jgi:hypothetical protein
MFCRLLRPSKIVNHICVTLLHLTERKVPRRYDNLICALDYATKECKNPFMLSPLVRFCKWHDNASFALTERIENFAYPCFLSFKQQLLPIFYRPLCEVIYSRCLMLGAKVDKAILQGRCIRRKGRQRWPFWWSRWVRSSVDLLKFETISLFTEARNA